ncbi:hypothetical protein B1690_02995 [Geobacillus sp. 46C-IIa]|uniref:DUF6230 family protein n=1 Tax=Geobacillus sp. 46C-IIa TaxID=1963025 RepID=UPI0009BD068E|nr:DUF6230 family protein [Geobacillus sp. 46C-IIa]OQP07512.1 hypothetical protein B1690_02995 [Geobacillus sp. 46C-IIa]QNU28322.1 hypothetical protein IC803_01710 [Geobacillus sp. 46C-IIa]
MEMATKSVIIGGHTAKKPLLAALLGGFLFLSALLSIFGLTGVAYALPLGGVGEFTIQFDKLNGQGFKMYGGMAESGETKQTPVFVNEIKNASIQGLKISKDFEALGLRVVIEAGGTVSIDGLVQKATQINGNISFGSLTMKENYVGDVQNPVQKAAQEFTQGADSISIENGDLKTVYLFQQKVSLPGMKVYFERLK